MPRCFANLKFLGLAALAVAATSASAGTLTLSGMHTNTGVTWTLNGTQESSGCGPFYGSYNGMAVDPLFCIDLHGWVSLPATFAVDHQTTYSSAGWLVKTYGHAVLGDSLRGTALQLAIWNATYENDLTVDSGIFSVQSDWFSGAAIAQANAYLAAMGDHKAYATEFIRPVNGAGQSQITTAPAPAAALAFLFGIGRRRKKA